METSGVRKEQVGQVRGFGDRQLRHPDDPEHASNRRVSVIVQYLTAPPAPKEEKAGEKGKPEEKKTEEKKPPEPEKKH